ncbi:TetR/AcrR family transcriptional regulator [Oricola sp.]|uniref:TetR/AcrR family transcriptional regulator n=1 Tax=Oricola sp. TaxID=1979950 RepID=UPI0025FD859D|nr:TetR/AcrR family transcriptional regulator [Oricola sp.]MCI5074107.1 TetR/AcrR family transcriptional regulator [Oricola sp.]
MSDKSRNNAESRARKIAILDATARLLREEGLQAFSFDAVATKAGLSRQLVRYYYPKLDELIVDLCDYLAMAYQEMLTTRIVEVGEVERLNFFLDFFFGVSGEHPMPNNLEVYDAFFAYAVGSSALRDRLCDNYKVLGQVIGQELAISHPELDPAACSELSFIFVSMMHAHWGMVASLGFSSQHNRMVRNAFDRLIASYVKDGPTDGVTIKPWARGS